MPTCRDCSLHVPRRWWQWRDSNPRSSHCYIPVAPVELVNLQAFTALKDMEGFEPSLMVAFAADCPFISLSYPFCGRWRTRTACSPKPFGESPPSGSSAVAFFRSVCENVPLIPSFRFAPLFPAFSFLLACTILTNTRRTYYYYYERLWLTHQTATLPSG